MDEILLPLFPLNVVLYPHTDLPLHIFEERYKSLIGESILNNSEFGVVLAEDGSVADIGCTAFVSRVIKRYDDGRLDIIVRGSRRFEVLTLDQEEPCLRCTSEFFDDETVPPLADDQGRVDAVELFRRVAKLLSAEVLEGLQGELSEKDDQLSFQIMARLPGELEFKQSLMPLRSEEERLKRVISHLNRLVAQLGIVVKARERAQTNGHRN